MENMIEMVKVEKLLESSDNRKVFNKQKMEELAASIKRQGIITPLIVCEIPGNRYEIVAGARRFRAAKELNIKEVPCLVRKLDESEAAQVRIIENLQREDLGPLDEGKEYHRLLKGHGMPVDDIAAKVCKKKSYVLIRLGLVGLPEEILKGHAAGKIMDAHLLVIGRLNDPKMQVKLFNEITKFSMDPVAAERKMEEISRPYEIRYACFDKKKCATCACNTSLQQSIFPGEEEAGDGYCTDPECYKAKTEDHLASVANEFQKKGKKVVLKSAAKKSKIEAIPDSYISYWDKQVQKCKACKARVMILSAGYGKVKEDLGCADLECLRKHKENANKSNGRNSNEDWASRDTLNSVMAAAAIEKVKKNMTPRMLLALKIERLIQSSVFSMEKALGMKNINYNIPLKKIYDLGESVLKEAFTKVSLEDMEIRGHIAEEVLKLQGQNLKDLVITDEFLKKHKIEMHDGLTPAEFQRYANKQGVKCALKIPAARPEKKEAKKK